MLAIRRELDLVDTGTVAKVLGNLGGTLPHTDVTVRVTTSNPFAVVRDGNAAKSSVVLNRILLNQLATIVVIDMDLLVSTTNDNNRAILRHSDGGRTISEFVVLDDLSTVVSDGLREIKYSPCLPS